MANQCNNLIAMLSESVKRQLDRPALIDPDEPTYRTWTYRQLWHDIRNVAGHLHRLGVMNGDKVGLLAESRAWWPIADFAIMSLGACTVPIYPSLPANQVEHIASHSDMKGIFVQNQLQLKKLLEIDAAALPNVRFIVLLDREAPTPVVEQARERFSVYAFEEWLMGEVWSESDWEEHWRHLDRGHLATIVYTSGTTGLPKGAMLSHGNLLSNVEGIRPIVSLKPTDQSLSYLPLSHIFERTAGQFVTLQAGGTIAYSKGIHTIVDDFKKTPPTILTTVPRLLEKIRERILQQVEHGPKWKRALFHQALRYGIRARVEKQPVSQMLLKFYDKLVFQKIHDATGGRLETIVSGGAPLPYHVGVFFTAAGFKVVEGYGMTETSPVVAVNPRDAVVLGTVGKVLDNVRIKFAEDGELLVQGPNVMLGYFKDEKATSEAFTDDGWLRTGDMGELTPEGYLRITDRKKNLLVLSTGKKVTPAPIEAVILESPYIDQVMLIGQQRKYVTAIVVPNDDMVQAWLKAHGYPPSTMETYRHLDPLCEFLFDEVSRCVQNYAKFEQPKRIIIAKEPFTIENQLLTPTLKLKTKNILQIYQEEIEQLYADERSTSA
jgi:long-chain acyl-CoA synthetase